MSVKLMPQRLFLITYDSGDKERPQTIKIPIELYVNEEEFRKNIISFKCLHCGAKSYDECIEKENKIGT